MIPNYEKAMKSFSKRSKVKKEVEKKDTHVPPKNQREKDGNSPYERFLFKYKHFEDFVDQFSSIDLVFYFREKAKENGYNYIITNLQREAKTMKVLKENFSNIEICGLIEFLYESDQDYLDKSRLSINILKSNWINTIAPDMRDWVEDRYTPKSKQSSKKSSVREWTSSKNVDDSSVGVWE